MEGYGWEFPRSGIWFVVLGGCRTWTESPKGVRHDLGFPWILTYGLGSLRDGVWSGVHLNVGMWFSVPDGGGLDPR